ncbi:MAG: hypothetical protein M2R45_03777 [Verrucomicrobia subdivision 3 bacterium]|nr:hypothetical protein [Limisphaerales bacterium]MCS1416782.1 hypothetical protein [Limisphaerales bacterium]
MKGKTSGESARFDSPLVTEPLSISLSCITAGHKPVLHSASSKSSPPVGAGAFYQFALEVDTSRLGADFSAPVLEQLNLSHNRLVDLSSLSSLDQLTSLNLSGNRITGLLPITDLK